MQIGESKTFNYTGYVQKIVLDDFHQLNADNIMTPVYKLECYGAQASNGAYGNYTCAYLAINKVTELFLYVGGRGYSGNNTYGWNSNGSGYYYTCKESLSGSQSNISSYTYNYHCSGGATDISFGGTENSTNWNNTNHLNQIVIRAKGGSASNSISRTGVYWYQWNSYGNGTRFHGRDTTTSSKDLMRFYMADIYDNYGSWSSYYTKKEFENLSSSTQSSIRYAANNHTKYNNVYVRFTSNGAVQYGSKTKSPHITYSATLRSNSKSGRVKTQNHTTAWLYGLNDSDDTTCTSNGHVSSTDQETLSIEYSDKRSSSEKKNGLYSDLYADIEWWVYSDDKLTAEIYENTLQYYNATQYIGGKCNYDNYFDTSILTKTISQSNVRAGDGFIRITRVAATDLYKNSDIRFDSKLVNIMDYTDIINSFV